MKGILGRKAGMTSIFTSEGINIPVTVIEVIPNVVTNVLTKEKNNYDATQLSAFDRRDKTVSKPVLGHLKKAKTNGKYFTKEIRDMKGFVIGSKVDASIFEIGSFVDVSGQSKGKGFQGNIKRHNQKIGPKSHGGAGGSKPSRQTGSLGDVVSNRVFKGQTMPGHMGAVTRTMQNLKIISIDLTNNIIMLKGSIPGPNRGFVVVKEAIKGLPMPEPIEILDLNTSSTISRTDDESTSTIEKAKIATKLSPEVKKTDTKPEIQEKVIKEVQKNSEPKIIKNEKGDK